MDEEKIKNISDELSKSNTNSLLQYKQSGVISKVEILASPNSCNYCKNQQGEIFSIEEVMKIKPLPCKKCNHQKGYCRCTFLPVIE